MIYKYLYYFVLLYYYIYKYLIHCLFLSFPTYKEWKDL